MLLNELREKTGPQHREIEEVVPLLSPQFTREQYRALVRAWAPVHAYFDQAIWRFNQWPELGVDVETRKKSQWLDQDLRQLGLEPLPAGSFCFEHCQDFTQALGCAYVIEGSSLGSQVIGRHLAKRWELNTQNGGRYYHFYGDQTGPFWKSYLQAVTTWEQGKSPAEISRVAEAAANTFSALTRHFQKHLPPPA